MGGDGQAMTVSVVIPTWNRAATLEAAVRSALAQNVPPLEVLVCDDGSTDGSEGVVRAISEPRVRWVPGRRGGRPAIPRNRGIREARGDWVAFLDSDDEWLPEKLRKQLSQAAGSGCRAACSNARRRVPGAATAGLLLADLPDRVTFDDLLQVNHVVCSSVIAEKSIVLRASGFPESPELKAIEDYALWLRIATITDFTYSREPLLWYNDDPAASLRRDDPDVRVQRSRVLADFRSWVEGGGAPASFLAKASQSLADREEKSILARFAAFARRSACRMRP
ncbi:MAG TPA: glycosyltransferase [Candidatus Deferrimicrobium sp.]